MAAAAQPDYRLLSQERFKERVEFPGSIKDLGIVTRQNDLQGLRVAEDHDGRHSLPYHRRETIAIATGSAAHE